MLEPKDDNRVARLAKLDNPDAVVRELFRAVLSRDPTPDERTRMVKQLRDAPEPSRNRLIGQMVWAMLASMEFGINH